MDLKKDVFTTFDVAKLCNANITSIKNWIEAGEIAAFRTPGGHYRIKREEIEAFLARHEMPNPFDALKDRSILVMHQDEGVVSRLQERLGADYTIDVAEDPIDGLIKLGHMKPRAIVIDSTLDDIDTRKFCERVTSSTELGHVSIILCGLEHDDAAERAKSAGAHHVVKRSEGDFGLLNALLAVMTA